MNLPEDHMDELFRKASELYPLKTDGADWDKVMTRLQGGPEDPAAVGAASHSSSRRWWWLMVLLLPFSWICARYTGVPFGHTHQTTAVSAVAHEVAGTTVQQPSGSTVQEPAGSKAPGASANNAGSTTASAHKRASEIVFSSPAKTNTRGSAPDYAATSTDRASVPTTTNASAPRSVEPATPSSTKTLDNAVAQDQKPPATESPKTDQTKIAATESQKTDTARTKVATTESPKTNTDQTKIAATESPKTDTAQTTAASPKTDTARPKVATAAKPKTTTKSAQRGFYAGFLAGPDLSTVKWQQLENPGYSLGILVGYRFNRHLAVEASALWDHKEYYTSGEYFNKAKSGIPDNVSINDLNGQCSMFEIPLSLRWDFLQLKHGGLYITGGFSSYMMKGESYSYVATYGVTSWDTSKSYHNSGNDFFSMMHLSLGYTFQWGHIGDVRIEPYLKIPLTGVGIGNLPITSTGLYIGLTHSFR